MQTAQRHRETRGGDGMVGVPGCHECWLCLSAAPHICACCEIAVVDIEVLAGVLHAG